MYHNVSFCHCWVLQLIANPLIRNPNVPFLSLNPFTYHLMLTQSCCRAGPGSGLLSSIHTLAWTFSSLWAMFTTTALSPHSPALLRGPGSLVFFFFFPSSPDFPLQVCKLYCAGFRFVLLLCFVLFVVWAWRDCRRVFHTSLCYVLCKTIPINVPLFLGVG